MLELRTPHDYIAAITRRRLALAIPLLVGAAASLAVALLWPPKYQSVATILIEEPDVPRDLVTSTVTSYADQRIQVISQRVMTTPNLVSVIDKFGLYQERRKYEPISVIVDSMREDIDLELVSAEVIDPRSGRATKATIAFTLSFEHRSSRTAQSVLSELVDFFLGENLRSRRQKAAETTDFLKNEAEKYRQLLDELEEKLSQFKQLHSGNLPEQLPIKLQMKERVENALLENRRQTENLEERKIYLEAELSQIDPTIELPQRSNGAADPVQRLKAMRTEFITLSSKYGPNHPDVRELARKIEALEQEVGPAGQRAVLEEQRDAYREELAKLRAKYSEKHPDVVRLRRQLADVEAKLETIPANSAADEPTTTRNPAYIRLKADLASTETELKTLAEQNEQLTERIAQFEKEIMAAPEIERQYRLLMRDYERQLNNYDNVKTKLTSAELGQSLEAESKAEQFSLVEPPTRPVEPVKPNRPAILALGVALSLSIGVGLVALREVLDATVYGPLQLASVAGVPPLVVIPRIVTAGERKKSWLLWGVTGSGLVVGLLAAVLVFHVFYMPLDVLWAVLERYMESFVSSTFGG